MNENPFKMDRKHLAGDGDREAVLAKFTEHTWPAMQAAIRQKPDFFVGKVRGCYGHPEPCHGHIIAAFVNGGCR